MTWLCYVLCVVLVSFLPVIACADDPFLVIDPGGHLGIIKAMMFTRES